MPETNANKRVRTGCMTCRKRRRKCDEQKPQCDNCRSKGFTCHYGSKLTFVTSKFQNAVRSPGIKSPEIDQRFPTVSPVVHATDYGSRGTPPVQDEYLASPESLTRSISAGLQSSGGNQAEQHSAFDCQQPAPGLNRTSTHGTRRDAYELELLTYYRYHVAPVMDLGLGSLCFGVQFLLNVKASESMYHAVLSLASSQRAALQPNSEQIDRATSFTSEYLVGDDVQYANSNTSATAKDLLLWKDLCLSPIQRWPSLTIRVLDHASSSVGTLEQWAMSSRLHCACVLSSDPRNTVHISFPPPQHETADRKFHAAVSQLAESLWLLERTFALFANRNPSSERTGIPPAQSWHAQWKDLQEWFASRAQEIRPVFEVETTDSLQQTQLTEIEFPHIVFSSGCATVANVAHHVASYIMLQHKPRLIKAISQTDSSMSFQWHAQKAIGAVAAAADCEVWDPFMTATLIYCSQRLSSVKERDAVARTLKSIQAMSGLKLETVIHEMETSTRDS